MRCLDVDASKAMVEEINVLRKRNESLGGVFEVHAFGHVPGLGSHVSWEERLDGRIGLAMLSIQAVKGCGIGDGFDLAGRPGSAAHDEIFYSDERGYYRETNRSGGVEGGMTTGEPLVVRCAMKPLPTLTKPLRSVDIATHEPAEALRERTDSCTVPAAGCGRRGDARDRARRRVPRQVRWRPHRRRPRRRRRVRAAHRMEAQTADIAGPTRRALVFIGFMGAGKTSAARAAAGVLGARAIDADHEIERRLGTTIEAHFEAHGEAAFRAVEEDVVSSLLDRPPAPVMSLGGGAVGSERVRELLRRHTVVLLDVDVETAWRRAGNKRRPLARDRDRFTTLFAQRAAALRVGRRRRADRLLARGGSPRRARAARRCRARRRARSCCGRWPRPAATRCTWGRGSWAAASGRSAGGAS